LPTAAGFGQMKIITADESSRVPVGGVRQIMESDAVAEHFGCVILEIDNIIAGLVMNRFERFQAVIPTLDDLLRRHRHRFAAGQRSHIEQHVIREARFHLRPIAIVRADKKLIHYVDDGVFFEQHLGLIIHNTPILFCQKEKIVIARSVFCDEAIC
jgi:hypothetical protein